MGEPHVDACEGVAPARHVSGGFVTLHRRAARVDAGYARAGSAGQRIAEYRAAGVRGAPEKRASARAITCGQSAVAALETQAPEGCAHPEIDPARRAIVDIGVLEYRRLARCRDRAGLDEIAEPVPEQLAAQVGAVARPLGATRHVPRSLGSEIRASDHGVARARVLEEHVQLLEVRRTKSGAGRGAQSERVGDPVTRG